MREGLVGLCHFMHLITFADGAALALEGIQDFRRQGLSHGCALRASAKSTSQRIARDNWRSRGTSTGTW